MQATAMTMTGRGLSCRNADCSEVAGDGGLSLPRFHRDAWSMVCRGSAWIPATAIRFATEPHLHQSAAPAGGHIGQGRLKAFLIEQYEHLLTVLRHVERDPQRASLVTPTTRPANRSLHNTSYP